MKHTLVIALWILIASPLLAQQLQFTWDINADAAQVTGYRLYQTRTAGIYTGPPVATFAGGMTTTGTIPRPAIGRYFYTLTAYTTDPGGDLESPRSNEVAHIVFPLGPTLHGIIIQIAEGYEQIGAGLRQLAAYVAEQPTGAVGLRGLRVQEVK